MSAAPTVISTEHALNIAKKVQEFKGLRILHPRLIDAEKEMMVAIRDCPRNAILYLYGPSGVGKSTLKEKLESNILREASLELVQNKNRVALVSVEAPSPDSGTFKWREHFKLILQSLDEPLLDLRTDRVGQKLTPSMILAAQNNARVAVAAYQTSVTTALKFRQPIALITDEAQHIAKVASGRHIVDQLDVIKSVANSSETPHLLVGTYELLKMRILNGQAARRSLEVDFGRYRADVDEDAIAFRDVIDKFARKMPFDKPPNLLAHWDFLYERTIGCVGILKDWLVRALSQALWEDTGTVQLSNLQDTALSVKAISRLLDECLAGEAIFKETEEEHKLIRARMKLDRDKGRQPTTTPQSVEPATQPAPKRIGKPFERLPRRDPIGIEVQDEDL